MSQSPGRPADFDPHEMWVSDIFEPCRKEHFDALPSGPIKWFLKDREMIPTSAHVVYLVGKHPQQDKPWLEALVFRLHRMVQVFLLTSHGRRWFRSLVYTSNANLTLHALQPSTENRMAQWPLWARHEAKAREFDNLVFRSRPPSYPSSLVIIRERKRRDAEGDTLEADKRDQIEQREAGSVVADVRPNDSTRAKEGSAGAANTSAVGTYQQKKPPEEPNLEFDPNDPWAPLCTPTAGDGEETPAAIETRPRQKEPPPSEKQLESLEQRIKKLDGILKVLDPPPGAPPVFLHVHEAETFYHRLPAWEMQGESCMVGLRTPVMRGRVMFEVSFFAGFGWGDVRVGWASPAFVPFDGVPEVPSHRRKNKINQVSIPDG